MRIDVFLCYRKQVEDAGFADEIKWAEEVGPPIMGEDFFCEYAWVIINSGMKYKVACTIRDRIWAALSKGNPVSSAFGHPGKAAAIQKCWDNQDEMWQNYMDAEDKLAHLVSLPWIGKITKYHLARNLGVDVCKPDRHLVRIAAPQTPHEYCSAIAEQSGIRIGAVDAVLWRAAIMGIL